MDRDKNIEKERKKHREGKREREREEREKIDHPKKLLYKFITYQHYCGLFHFCIQVWGEFLK